MLNGGRSDSWINPGKAVFIHRCHACTPMTDSIDLYFGAAEPASKRTCVRIPRCPSTALSVPLHDAKRRAFDGTWRDRGLLSR